MVRLVLVIAALAVGFVVVKRENGEAGAGTTTPLTPPAVSTLGMPRGVQKLIASRPDPTRILRQRGALPGLGAIRRIAGKGGDDAAATTQLRPFADVGSARELRAVRRDIRRDFAALNQLSASRGGASPAQV